MKSPRPRGFAPPLAAVASADAGFRRTAFDATWAAEHDRALAALHNATWPGSGVMRARIYAREGLIARALDERLRAAAGVGGAERGELAAIVAELHAIRGERTEALLALHDATDAAPSGDRALRAQLRVTNARVELAAGNARRAMADIAAGLVLTDDLVELGAEYRLEPNHIRARLFDVRARVHALRHDDTARLDDLCRATRAARLVRHRDVWHEADLLASISELVAASPQPAARHLLETCTADLSWTPRVAERESEVHFNLARAATLFGAPGEFGAAAKPSAPTLGARLALDADRLLLDEWKDVEDYERELAFAAELAESVAWGDVAGDDVASLGTIAALLAPYDASRACAMRERYDGALATLSRGARGFHESRRVAFDDFGAACVAKAAGDDERARTLFDGCIAFWHERELHAWSALGSLERYALTRDDADLAAARAFVAERPRSRFSARLRAALGTAAATPEARFPYLRVVSRTVRASAAG